MLSNMLNTAVQSESLRGQSEVACTHSKLWTVTGHSGLTSTWR